MKSHWKKLTIDDLRLVLSEDETQKLNEMSKDSSISAMINQQIEVISQMFRGALLAKSFKIDIRDGYVPQEYIQFILNYSRYQIWSRFPNSKNIAIDEVRDKLYEEAVEVLKNPYINVAEPDYSGTELSGYVDRIEDSAIYVPYRRIFDYYEILDRNELSVQ